MSFKTISLYAGAGGLDLGFSQAGFDLVWANEVDEWACETYRANLGSHIHCSDVLSATPPSCDLVIGGPPCQGFSVIGKMHPEDPRSSHVFHFLDVVERVQPKAFVMENVKGLAVNPRWNAVRKRLIHRATALGFETKLFLLNAADFGVPQARERMFLVGMRDKTPRAPEPVTAHRPPTVREAFARLPRFGEPGNDTIINAKVQPAARPVLRPSPYRGSLLFNGSGRPLHLDSPAKTLPASMGGNATPIVDQDEIDDGAEPWVVAYHRRLRGGGSPIRRAPKRLRRLTLEEAAVLQSFPSDWIFKGPRVSQLRQVGNAVPPRLALHVAQAVKNSLLATTDLRTAALEAAA